MASSSRQMPKLFAAIGSIMLAVSCAVEGLCPEGDLVYLYQCDCFAPAVYGEAYYIVSDEGGLVGEWDETNNTYYVRLTGSPHDVGDAITLVPLDPRQYGSPVRHRDNVGFATPGARFWEWSAEAETEWFLVEREENAACFQVVHAVGVALPCPRALITARCEAYYLTSAPGAYTGGLAKYVENGVTYIKLGDKGSHGDLSLLLIRPSNVIKGRTSVA